MRVLLTGGSGMLGQALRRLAPALAPGWTLVCPTRADCDLRDKAAVARLLEPGFDLVIHAAAKVGGIAANIAEPVAFLVENMEATMNVINGSASAGVRRLLFLGSSCMYPKDYINPLREDYLLAAPLEPTNEGYALAKIAGAKLCEYLRRERELSYATLIPCNLYGPGDHFEAGRSHLVASVIHKLHEARTTGANSVEIWGDGLARREFLYVDDLAAFILGLDPARIDALPAYLNLGYGSDHSVLDYYKIGAEVVGFNGRFTFNLNAPVGMKQKLLDSSKAEAIGWSPATSAGSGMRQTYAHYLQHLGG